MICDDTPFTYTFTFILVFNTDMSCAMCAAVKPPLPGPAFTNWVSYLKNRLYILCIYFRRSAPQLWNSLPPNIRNSDSLLIFKSRLKTHLFKIGHSL